MNLPGVDPRELTLRVFKEQGGEELLIHQAEQELRAVDIANDFIDVADGEPIEDIPEPEDRAAQLTRGIVNLVEGDIEGYYAQEYARARCDCTPGDVLPYVDLTVDEWLDQKEAWRDAYDLPDRDVDEVAQMHVDLNFGVSLDEFVGNVVAWNEGDDANVVERLLRGDHYDDPWRVFTGNRTAQEGLRWAYRELHD